MGFSRSQKPSSYGGTPMTMETPIFEIHNLMEEEFPVEPVSVHDGLNTEKSLASPERFCITLSHTTSDFLIFQESLGQGCDSIFPLDFRCFVLKWCAPSDELLSICYPSGTRWLKIHPASIDFDLFDHAHEDHEDDIYFHQCGLNKNEAPLWEWWTYLWKILMIPRNPTTPMRRDEQIRVLSEQNRSLLAAWLPRLSPVICWSAKQCLKWGPQR